MSCASSTCPGAESFRSLPYLAVGPSVRGPEECVTPARRPARWFCKNRPVSTAGLVRSKPPHVRSDEKVRDDQGERSTQARLFRPGFPHRPDLEARSLFEARALFEARPQCEAQKGFGRQGFERACRCVCFCKGRCRASQAEIDRFRQEGGNGGRDVTGRHGPSHQDAEPQGSGLQGACRQGECGQGSRGRDGGKGRRDEGRGQGHRACGREGVAVGGGRRSLAKRGDQNRSRRNACRQGAVRSGRHRVAFRHDRCVEPRSFPRRIRVPRARRSSSQGAGNQDARSQSVG